MTEKKHKWIKKALGDNSGKFKAKAEEAGKSTSEFASEHEGDEGKLGKEARLAKTLMGMRKKSPSGKKMHHQMYGKEK